jgi:hypothetical protein
MRRLGGADRTRTRHQQRFRLPLTGEGRDAVLRIQTCARAKWRAHGLTNDVEAFARGEGRGAPAPAPAVSGALAPETVLAHASRSPLSAERGAAAGAGSRSSARSRRQPARARTLPRNFGKHDKKYFGILFSCKSLSLLPQLSPLVNQFPCHPHETPPLHSARALHRVPGLRLKIPHPNPPTSSIGHPAKIRP